MKNQIKVLTEELEKANQTIQFLSQITGANPLVINDNIQNMTDDQFKLIASLEMIGQGEDKMES